MSSPHRNTLAFLIILLGAMIALSFASVPLYRIFCQTTGFGGTPKIAVEAPSQVYDRTLKILFNADVSPDLPWSFRPLQREVTVKVGQTALIFFKVRNYSPEKIVGWASYNVTPDKAGSYFAKMQCFCFSEQIIEAGQEIEMPVSFYIDPALLKDKELDDVTTITLSYTFFRYKGQTR